MSNATEDAKHREPAEPFDAARPLSGIRIVEVEGLGPAPFAGMLLADLGADVIVVHRPVPPTPNAPERSVLDRGKRSIVLDLKSADDSDVFLKLVATADGLIEAFRPGVMERLGFGPDELRLNHPKLVYGRLTGWGQVGPLAHTAGHDLNYLALSGALWFATREDGAPVVPPTTLGDIGGGAMYLVAGMLAALLQAERTGRGTVVDAAIVDGSAHAMTLLLAAASAGMAGAQPGSGVLDGAPWSRCYRTADGRWLAVQCLEPPFYQAFLEKLDLGDDADLRQTLDRERWPAIATRFAGVIEERSLAEWTERFDGSDACVAPVLSPQESAEHAHMDARSTWTLDGDRLYARAAPLFDGAVPGWADQPPRRGEHSALLRAIVAADSAVKEDS